VTEPSHAVFLSYASQDAEAAQKICQALRSAGIEVFLDQSELRSGDAWDQKIRREIQDCALFIPVISANTASRHEGYFRLEWDLSKLKAEGDAAAYQYATIYAQWGNRAQALEWLETALRLRDPGLESLKTDPLLDPLRKEPRFQAIERELKFPD
jgi:hypothetical protein